jgi:hypothetical protein
MTEEQKMDTPEELWPELPGKVAGGADDERHDVLVVAKEGSVATTLLGNMVYKAYPKVEFAIHSRDLFGSSPATGWDWLTKLLPEESDKPLKVYDTDMTQQLWEEMIEPPSTGHKVVVLDLSLNSTDNKERLPGGTKPLSTLLDEFFTADIPGVGLWVCVRQWGGEGCTDSFEKHFKHIVANGSILHPTGSFDEKKNLRSEFGQTLGKDWIPSKETKQSTVEEKKEEEVGEEKELTNPRKTAKQYALNTLCKRTKIGVCDTTSPTAASYSPSHSWAGNIFRLLILVLIVLAPVATAVDIVAVAAPTIATSVAVNATTSIISTTNISTTSTSNSTSTIITNGGIASTNIASTNIASTNIAAPSPAGPRSARPSQLQPGRQ